MNAPDAKLPRVQAEQMSLLFAGIPASVGGGTALAALLAAVWI